MTSESWVNNLDGSFFAIHICYILLNDLIMFLFAVFYYSVSAMYVSLSLIGMWVRLT